MGAAIALGFGFLLLSLFGKGGGSPAVGPGGPWPRNPGKRGPSSPSNPGGTVTPGPANTGPLPKGRGYGGGQWGTGKVPADFDWNSNDLYLSPECDTVAEALYFMPSGRWISECEADTLADTLDHPECTTPPNAVYGFLAYLLDTEGLTDPIEIATRVMLEAQPGGEFCIGMDPDTWPEPLALWWTSFVDRVTEYVEASINGIGFDPEN